MPMPVYLYHATTKANAKFIIGRSGTGLEPRSVGGEEDKYLCMSGTEKGAATLGAQASDVILRVKSADLDADTWSERGAGKKEWRSTEGVPKDKLEYRRNLGTPEQIRWRSYLEWPAGLGAGYE